MLYIKNDSIDPYFNHAMEEYYLENSNEEIFILWQNRPSILIGRNQNTRAEIDLAFVEKNKIDVVRRLSGGGTVFCDLGNFNFTFITNKTNEIQGFQTFALPLIKALQDLGVNAKFTGRNDITIEGKKISGNAQYHKGQRLLHHGTLLFNGDLASLKGALISKPLKFKDKSIKSVASRVTNIYPHLPSAMTVNEFKTYLSNYIMKMYEIKDIYLPSQEELSAIKAIRDRRFATWEWTYGKSPNYSYENQVKYPFGGVEYYLDVIKGHIKEAHIYGDFFGTKSIEDIEQALIGCSHDYDSIKSALSTFDLNDYISGIRNDHFIKDCCQSNPSQEQSVNQKKIKKKRKGPGPKPEWLRIKLASGKEFNSVNQLVKDLNLNTVCLEANCPNRMECFNRKTATFMILGRNCTRNCTFCNVTKTEPDLVDPLEPSHVAQAVKRLGLKHAVITSVTRDDLKDQGANQFVQVVEEIRKVDPSITIELLIPDMQGDEQLLDLIIDAKPNVINHNIETIPSLYDTVRPMANYQRSLNVISYVKKRDPHMTTKSGMMLGLGENQDQVIESMKDLLASGCDILTLGQYLQPSKAHIDLVEYISPDQFHKYKSIALNLGFHSVASAPLVRSSYHADELL